VDVPVLKPDALPSEHGRNPSSPPQDPPSEQSDEESREGDGEEASRTNCEMDDRDDWMRDGAVEGIRGAGGATARSLGTFRRHRGEREELKGKNRRNEEEGRRLRNAAFDARDQSYVKPSCSEHRTGSRAARSARERRFSFSHISSFLEKRANKAVERHETGCTAGRKERKLR
jgi:hypothetical protein